MSLEQNETHQAEKPQKVSKIKDRLNLAFAILIVIGLAIMFLWTANYLGIKQEYRDHYYETALDYAASGNYQSAVQNLNVFLKHYPEDYEANFAMGKDLMTLNKPLEARPYLSEHTILT